MFYDYIFLSLLKNIQLIKHLETKILKSEQYRLISNFRE